MLSTIGPVWDGNEVWLLVAAGATFAAFPQWYATLFSGFYLALLLVLAAADPARRLVRVAAQGRAQPLDGRMDGARTRPRRRRAGLWGVALSSLLYGVPIDSDMRLRRQRSGTSFSRYTVLAGARGRRCSSPSTARRSSPCARPASCTSARGDRPAAWPSRRPSRASAFARRDARSWRTQQNDKDVFPAVIVVAATVVAALAIPLAVRSARSGVRAFVGHGGDDRASRSRASSRCSTRACSSPRPDFANSLTIENAASGALHAEGHDHRRGA